MSIDVLPTSEQRMLVESVERTLEDVLPVARLEHGAKEGTLDEEIWARLAELGWIGLALPESVGGIGCELTDAVLVHRALGRNLVSPALTASVVAAMLATETGDEALAAGLCAGVVRAAFAIPCAANKPDGDHFLLDAAPGGVVVALLPGGASLATVDFARTSARASFDPAVRLRCGRLNERSGRISVEAGRWAEVLIAAELVGLAQEAMARAVDYAKVREQFGKPIGSFQAVAHMCADCMVRSEAAASLTNFAAIAIRDGRDDAAFQTGAASRIAAEAALANATTNIQVQGGMGFAAESDAHLFLKRAMLLRALVRSLSAKPRSVGEAVQEGL